LKTKEKLTAQLKRHREKKERSVAIAHENNSGSYRRDWENAFTLLKKLPVL
jgi:hypothetical protein